MASTACHAQGGHYVLLLFISVFVFRPISARPPMTAFTKLSGMSYSGLD